MLDNLSFQRFFFSYLSPFFSFKQCISQTLNYYLLFPTNAGAVCPGSVVHETDDAEALLLDDGTSYVPEEQSLMLESNNMQVCVILKDFSVAFNFSRKTLFPHPILFSFSYYHDQPLKPSFLFFIYVFSVCVN